MKSALAAHAALLALLAAGCGSDIDTGYVTQKVYEPQWTETQYTNICLARNPKTQACTNNIRTPHYITHPPEWRLNLKEADKKGYAYVAQETFDRYRVGDHYPDPR